MARVTIEDSLKNADNVFELIRLAAMRAYQLQNGAQPHINPGNSKVTVIALREIAAGYIDIERKPLSEDGEYPDDHGE